MRFDDFVYELTSFERDEHGLKLEHIGRTEDGSEEFWLSGKVENCDEGSFAAVPFVVKTERAGQLTEYEATVLGTMTQKSRETLQRFIAEKEGAAA